MRSQISLIVMMIIVLICRAVTGTSFVKTLRQAKLGKIYLFTTLVGLILMIFGLILIVKEVFFSGEFLTREALLGETAFLVGLIAVCTFEQPNR